MAFVRTAVLGLSLAAAAWTQAPALYQFSFDQDNLHGTPDFGWMNHPLTPADRVFTRNGHFYTVGADLTPGTRDDRRVRLYGMNLAFGANFPTAPDAVRVARRLRRLGVNLVRLHHMDSSPDPVNNPSSANSALLTGPYPAFNETSLQRLRDLLTALAAEGIYANLNLHVGYTFRPAIDLVPAPAGEAMPTQSKPLHIFYPRMLELQQEYAAQLIRRLRLRGDPVLAMVEINNESSLIYSWQSGELDPLLAGEYRTALQKQWNGWLAAKYANTAAIDAAWGAGAPDGPDLLNGKWTLEQGHGKSGTLSMTTTNGLPTAQVQQIASSGQGPGWLFLKQTGFHLDAGVRYIWSFQARADAAAGRKVSVPLSVMRDVSPWDGILYSTISLTDEWQTFTIALTPGFAIQDSGRVSLDVEFAPGGVYARQMSLVRAGQRGLAAGESLEAGNISLLKPSEGATAARMNDYTLFLIGADRVYVNAMRDAVRAETDALVPVTGTQMGYGGLAILDSQDGLDYQDNHFYIDHYNFPNTAWDGFDWRIRDSAAADNTWQSFTDMAWARQAGRPYTVSEFNQPWPNTHGAEIDPSLAAFGAFQDWDAIVHFAYSHSRGWNDGVPNGFNINGDWTKFPIVGQSAWLFRRAALQAGAAPLDVPVSAEQRLASSQAAQSVSSWVVNRAGMARETALTRRVQLAKDSPAEISPDAKAIPKPPFVSDTGELRFDKDASLLVLNAPAAAGVFGAIGRDTVTAGAIDIKFGPSTRSSGCALLTSLDDQPIAAARRMLLTIPGYSLRSLPGTAQPQKLVNYPNTSDWWTIQSSNARPSGDLNSGNRPTFLERVEAWVTLRTNASELSVSALDGSGEPAAELASSEIERVPGGFRLHLNADSPWYSIRATQPGARRREH